VGHRLKWHFKFVGYRLKWQKKFVGNDYFCIFADEIIIKSVLWYGPRIQKKAL
jgi:hypothetical protein